ncbi:MAG: helix-turn-helix transcriptional regulator, partial [Treponema sp.]|nr:helix-turn-helix transcriptional regulator [Treponema sp.]MDY5759270.1 helix-turn-helix transcriptional regulator [Treponema sp.]
LLPFQKFQEGRAREIILFMEETELDIPDLFGKNVQKYRKMAGLTQSELSKRLEISQKHLSIIETGTQFASANLIARISKELNVPPAALFGDDLTQTYFDKLFARLATYMENKFNTMRVNLSTELSRQLDEKLPKQN